MATKRITDQDIITWSKQNKENFYDWMLKSGYSTKDASYAGRKELWNKKFGNTPYQGTEAQNRKLWSALEEKPEYYLPPTNSQTQQLFKQANYNQPQLYQNNNPDIPKKKTWIDKYNDWNDHMMKYRLVQDASKVADNTISFLDIPRRAIAVRVNAIDRRNDPDYDATNLFDLQHAATHSTPIVGKEYAAEHPVQSILIDLLAPAAVFEAASATPGIVKNIVNYSRRVPVDSTLKSKVLDNILHGVKDPNGMQYEVVTTNKQVPWRYNQTENTQISNNVGGKRLTGTSNSANGRPYAKGSTVQSGKTRGAQVNGTENRAETQVYQWQKVPVNHSAWLGVPQMWGKQEQYREPQYTINTETPFNMNDSEYVRASGIHYGDTIVMPDGRVLKYVPGGNSNGRKNYSGIHEEFDRDSKNVKNQRNVPNKTNVYNEQTAPMVYVTNGRNADNLYRNPNYYYPKIVPLNR